jgi:bacteriocin biosynthesis cyclodehydratase domain-containing protein
VSFRTGGEGAAQGDLARGPVLRLRPGLTIVPGGDDDPDATWAMINSRVLRLRGESARRLLAAIDGTRTLEGVAEALGAASPAALAAAVERLRSFGLLEPEGSEAFAALSPLVRALADLGADGVAVAAELARARVAVVGDGALGRAVGAALEGAGVGGVVHLAPPAGDEDAPAGLLEADAAVAALDAGDPDTLARLNALALRLELPWIQLEARGFELRVGPFFLPGQTACWTCYESRLEANAPGSPERRAVRAAQQRSGAPQAPADDVTPGVAGTGAEICALEVVRFFAARVSEVAPELYGAFADYSLLAHRAAPHRVLRLPRCPSCGVRASGLPTVRAWMEPYDYRDPD